MPVKGWAHALAHTADLLQELGKSRFVEKDGLENMLDGISNKLVDSTNWVYIHGEDERLANAVTAILGRELVTLGYLKEWLKSLTEPEKSWNGAYMDEGQSKAFHNVRNFLRSISEAVRKVETLPKKDKIAPAIFDALR
ncbi:MAG: DUF2785 domain-containing protein [Anaerolineae bacterium]|nr:DUF2785 domain-containing protein [Anaerolineae bacterium]